MKFYPSCIHLDEIFVREERSVPICICVPENELKTYQTDLEYVNYHIQILSQYLLERKPNPYDCLKYIGRWNNVSARHRLKQQISNLNNDAMNSGTVANAHLQELPSITYLP